jgi:hypothetical protein
MTEIPNTDNFMFGICNLVLGAYLLFGIWSLEFVPKNQYLSIPLNYQIEHINLN